MKFSDLGLSDELLKAIEEVGYTTPTPIQQQAIPVILMGRDVLGCAQTGTGKTAGFTLPMIEILAAGRAKARMPRSLIIAPTRELAAQVANNFEQYGKHHKLAMALLIGGESFSDQEKALDRGVDVLIATPGRLLDLFERGRILLNDVKILVIDEADRMLDMGFIPDVERIVSLIPKIRQTLFFSATMAPEIRRLADAFLMNPKEISVAPPASAATTVTQGLVVVEDIDKREALRHLLRTENVKNAFIFCNRKRDVDILFRSLTKHGFSAVQMHGDLPQSTRMETLDRFKKGDVVLMVCSDVAARGIDVSDVSHVFNFDVPIHAEDYVHRIGRTGRAGREGHAYTIATPEDGKYVKAINDLIGIDIPRLHLDGVPPLELSMDDSRRKRKREKDRPVKGGKRREERPAADEQPARQAQPEREERLERVERPERPERQPREERPERQAREDRPERQERQPREDRTSNNRDDRANGRRDRGYRRRPFDEFGIGEMSHPDNVVGFGDHVPDFILNEFKLPPKSSAKDDDIDSDNDYDADIELPADAAIEADIVETIAHQGDASTDYDIKD